MIAIFKTDIRKNMHDKGLYFWTLVLPVIFIVLFTSIFTMDATAAESEEVILSIIPGYTTMFTFFIMISMCSSFISDRDNGMVARLASTPLPAYSYIIGKWMSYMVIVVIQIGVMFIFGKVVYNIPLEQPIYIGLISIILSISITGIGVALSLAVKTNNMGISITQVVAMGGSVVGGLWLPLEFMPEFIQKVGKFTPHFWAHDAFKQAMTGSLHVSSFLLFALVLIGFGCMGFIIARIFYPRFLRRAKG